MTALPLKLDRRTMELPPDLDVLDPDEAQRYLRLFGKKFEEVSPRLPWTILGERTRIISRRLLLEWVEANAEIVDPKQQHRRRYDAAH